MQQPYNQIKAMLAISKASLRSIFRSPSAVIFSLVFPLIFILVFGFLGRGTMMVSIAIDKNSNTINPVFDSLINNSAIKVVNKPDQEIKEDLVKGRITAIINIQPQDSSRKHYTIQVTSSSAAANSIEVLYSILQQTIQKVNTVQYPNRSSIAHIESNTMPGRIYRTIDFILPGQLGFSLLSAGVFGVAFLFFNLRNTLVLKRFFATPIRRSYIVFGEGISRVLFQLMTAVVIILVGHFAFNFTLTHGFVTFIELIILSLLALIVFMGFGFIVSGLAKNESVIPPFANLITLPQFLLAGTFFSIDSFPSWLQPICKILPLTHLNNAMRNIAFEGSHLWDCKLEIGILLLWGIVAYTIAIKTFKWE